MGIDIFVSYSSKDKIVADAIVSALENEKMRCWYAPRDIKPGADWGESITEAIHECKIILLIFSGSSNQSKRVLDEVYYAISEEKTIIPFRIENLDPTGADLLIELAQGRIPRAFALVDPALGHLPEMLAAIAFPFRDPAANPSKTVVVEEQHADRAPIWHGGFLRRHGP